MIAQAAMWRKTRWENYADFNITWIEKSVFFMMPPILPETLDIIFVGYNSRARIWSLNKAKLESKLAKCIAIRCPSKAIARVYKSWVKVITYVGEHKCAGLKVHEHSTEHKPTRRGLIVVDIDTLKFQVGGASVSAGGINAVLGTNHFPKLGTDLFASLTSLDV